MGSYYLPPSGSQIDSFAKLGTPGEFHSAEVVGAGNTGSAGAAVMLGASANVANTQLHTAGGGVIIGTDLEVKRIYSIGVTEVRATGGTVYVFKRK